MIRPFPSPPFAHRYPRDLGTKKKNDRSDGALSGGGCRRYLYSYCYNYCCCCCGCCCCLFFFHYQPQANHCWWSRPATASSASSTPIPSSHGVNFWLPATTVQSGARKCVCVCACVLACAFVRKLQVDFRYLAPIQSSVLGPPIWKWWMTVWMSLSFSLTHTTLQSSLYDLAWALRKTSCQ